MTPRDAAIAAARAAAALIRSQFGSQGERVDKGVLDFATPTDVQAEAAIIETLRRAFPDYGILAEESGQSDAKPGAPWWLIDPLCGTVNFAQGIPLFNTNIALMQGEEPVLGVLAEAMTGDVLVAEAGKGAVALDSEGGERPAQPSGDSRIICVDWGHFPSEGDPEAVLRLTANLTRSKQFRLRVLNTSLALGYVARGQLAAFVMDNTKPWDQGAGGLIVRAAGGIVTDFEGNRWTPASPSIIAAADEATHAVIMEYLK